MKEEPIVAEVRAIREELAKKAGYDLDKYLEMLRENGRKRAKVGERQYYYGSEAEKTDEKNNE